MKKMLVLIVFITLILSACASKPLILASTSTCTPEETAPQLTESLQDPVAETIVPTATQDGSEKFTIQTDGGELTFSLGMPMDAAETQLKQAGVAYIEDNDVSMYRSWSGRRLDANGFSLVFDLRRKLHEINIDGELKTSLPVAIGDMVTEVRERFGEQTPKNCPDEPGGPVAVEYYEYDMNGWYLRTVYGGERVPDDQYTVWQVTAAAYSALSYANQENLASLIVANTEGEEGTLSIGMMHDDVTAILDGMGVAWRQQNGSDDIYLNIGYSSDADGDGDPDEDDFIELYLEIKFDLADRVDKIDAYGAGARTVEGLAMGGSMDDMTALYGDGFIMLPREQMHIYQYVYGDNYLSVDIDDVTNEVCILSVSRYAGN